MDRDSLEGSLEPEAIEEPKEEEDPLLMELKRLEQDMGDSGASDIGKESSMDDTLKEIEQQEEDRAEKEKRDLEALEAESQNDLNGFETLESLPLQNDDEE
ncbi:unnamed protein product, partial [Scytosiphon promiscuus]